MEMLDIGNPVKLTSNSPGTADPQGVVNHKFRSFMNVVDIVPVEWKINLQGFTRGTNKYVTELNLPNGVKQFKSDCKGYELDPVYGLRLWLTGETMFQEEISNSFDENVISEALNSLSSKFEGLSRLRGLLKSAGTSSEQITSQLTQRGQDLVNQQTNQQDTSSNIAEVLGSATKGIFGTGGSLTTSVASIAGNIIMEGKKASLPKIWYNSEYNPSLALNVQLISPYGSPRAILEHVIKPLAYLYILAAPNTTDGVTYGKVRYIKLTGYGISNIDIGYIESISINRGGEDITYNKFRQPLSVNVNMTIKPAAPGFALVDSSIQGGIKGVKTNDFTISDFQKSGSNFVGNPRAAFTTVGKVLSSFKPAPSEITGIQNSDIISQISNPTTPAIPQDQTVNPTTARDVGVTSLSNAITSAG